MDTLAKLKQASVMPVYETINFSDLQADRTGAIRLRVNITKKMRDEIDAMQDAPDEEKNERALALIASLIPREDTGDEPLTTEEWKEFLKGGDDDDIKFVNAISDRLWERVTHYLRSDFLASKPSATN